MLNQIRTAFDVAIIGGGIAGLSTALWCDELGLSAVLLEEKTELGGQLLWVHNEIKNYLGREAENGRALRDAFLEQIEKRRFELRMPARVAEIRVEEKEIFLTDGTRLSASALVLATGIRRRQLNVQGEAEFSGRGIIESGKKNAAAATGKKVLIVGGGDAAFENALILAEKAEKVTLVHRRHDFRARAEFIEQVKNHPKVTILTGTVVQEISGGRQVESARLKTAATGETQILPADAVLIRIGVEPNTEIFRGKLKLDRAGYVEISRDCETSVAGVYAVGDVANPLAPTLSSAAGMGATAAKAIFSWINN
jgi:thioredoxin reductase (NADPH)